jgi:hypothetical protein
MGIAARRREHRAGADEVFHIGEETLAHLDANNP